jgi:hypothetical protein
VGRKFLIFFRQILRWKLTKKGIKNLQVDKNNNFEGDISEFLKN